MMRKRAHCRELDIKRKRADEREQNGGKGLLAFGRLIGKKGKRPNEGN